MKITSIEIKNFRLLASNIIDLADEVTLIVGRNNSGKTSVVEIFNKFLSQGKGLFKFDDFSVGCHKDFDEAQKLYKKHLKLKGEGADDDALRASEKSYKEKLPKIQLLINIEYTDSDDLASLSSFIMDLDPKRNDAQIICEYSVSNPEQFLGEYEKSAKKFDKSIIKYLKKHYKNVYKEKYYSVDSANPENFKEIENKKSIEKVFQTSFVYAQNQLDDQSLDKTKGLSRGFEDYYRFNNKDNADVESIEESLTKVSEELDGKYKDLFKGIFDDLKTFGVDTKTNIPPIEIKSNFDAEKVIRGNTQVFYDHDSNLLPEAHNGLGYSKLIYLILKFISFYEEYSKKKPKPNFHLLFLEEPEAHLHPQMQYVFIRNIDKFIRTKPDWNVQVIITTHSSHIVSESGFKSIRHFNNSPLPLRVRNLSEFYRKVSKTDDDAIKFLAQYMSLKNCDMFFADKAILVEGTVERILLPKMIEKEAPKLLTQYISIIEVGGAYAHKFKEFLEFIDIKTLIITDIDSVKKLPDKKIGKCKVDEGEKTTNAVLKGWLPKKELIPDLVACKDEEKVDGKTRVTYQKSEDGKLPVGRSFEDAFILKNARLLAKNTTGLVIPKYFKKKDEKTVITEYYEIAKKLTKLKTDFAFDILLLDKKWETPKYIKEGLVWLETE